VGVENVEMEPFPELGSLSDEELKAMIDRLVEEEQEISYRRRILHGKIDILKAEVVARLQKTGGRSVIEQVDVEKLADILASRGPAKL
jgi:hypothetical protein